MYVNTNAATSELFTSLSFRGDVAHHQGDVFYAVAQFLAEHHLFEIDLSGDGSTSDKGLIVSGKSFGVSTSTATATY